MSSIFAIETGTTQQPRRRRSLSLPRRRKARTDTGHHAGVAPSLASPPRYSESPSRDTTASSHDVRRRPGSLSGISLQSENIVQNRYPQDIQYNNSHHAQNGEFRERDVEHNPLSNVKTELDLSKWLETPVEELVESSHARYQLYYDQLRLSREHLDQLLSDTNANLDLLSTLSASFKTVEVQTSAFQKRCEELLTDQKRLSILAENVDNNLQFYDLLEPITKRLNTPGAGHFVRGDDFSEMLYNLDKCLEYMQTHQDHREAATYQAKYRLLLTRALTLIRVHFTNTLREIAADVSQRVADRQLNDTTMSTLLYAKFRTGAPELKRLGLEIQKRAGPAADAEPGTPGEYQSLMNELYQSYSAARGRLIIPMVRKKMADISIASSTSKDLVAFARSSISFMRGICLDEFELWHEWFQGDGGLYEFLELICEPLYDYLRPRTIHETQLTKLCEICSLIQARYMDEPEDEDEPIDPLQLDFSSLVRPALEDAQTRLVFLTLVVLRDDIERYKPKPADLEYPGRKEKASASVGSKSSKVPALSGKRNPVSDPQSLLLKTPKIVDEEGADPLDLQWRYDTTSNYSEWYPTLRKAIWLLSKIYRLVNSTVFDDLAHQIVHQTTLSLQQAANQAASKTSKEDSQLFLLKELLILKQQIVAFDIEFVTPEVNFDFSNVTNTFWELRERGGLFDPRNLFRLVGGGLMPRVVEDMLDAKAELDGRLRTVINEFTNGYADRMAEPIKGSAPNKKDFNAGNAVQTVRANIEEEVQSLRIKLDEYIEDVRIKETLVGAVQDQVLQRYDDFFAAFTAKAKADGSSIPKRGKGRDDGVWDSDTFADWSGTVFGVGRVGLHLQPDEDGDVDEDDRE